MIDILFKNDKKTGGLLFDYIYSKQLFTGTKKTQSIPKSSIIGSSKLSIIGSSDTRLYDKQRKKIN